MPKIPARNRLTVSIIAAASLLLAARRGSRPDRPHPARSGRRLDGAETSTGRPRRALMALGRKLDGTPNKERFTDEEANHRLMKECTYVQLHKSRSRKTS